MNPLVFRAVLALMPFLRPEAKALDVDPYELAGIVYVESRGVAGVVRHETNGSCSVGLAGINVPDCDPVAVEHLLLDQANLHAAAVILRAGYAYCREHPRADACRRGGGLAMYNPGNKGYASAVRRAAREIRKLDRRRRRRPHAHEHGANA